MLVLGLGTNVGNKLDNLRTAFQFLAAIKQLTILQVSPIYISDALLIPGSPPEWNQPYFNVAIKCETDLSPLALLENTKAIEIKMGRDTSAMWSPRPIDIDILVWDDLVQYDDKLHIPHEELINRPFALWPLADVAPFWMHPIHQKTATALASIWPTRFSGDAPLHTLQIPHRIDTPELIGIVNVTPDSFSDGGNFIDANVAITHCKNLVAQGATWLDIGAEASGPDAQLIDAAIEWQRLEPVLLKLMSVKQTFLITPKISIDTRYVSTAKKALALGVDCINDISGLADPDMIALIANTSAQVVLMHQLGIPANSLQCLSDTEDSKACVLKWANEKIARLTQQGLSKDQLIFDVGIGYGKTAAQSAELIRNAALFTSLGVKTLIGHSRKSFLSAFTSLPASERDLETAILSLHLLNQGVDYLRVHNIDMCTRAFNIHKSFF